jgi:hypothetical protein
MTSQARRIPDSLLECYLANALDAHSKARLEMDLASSPADQARLEELRADSAALLIQHPPGPLVERFRKERKRSWWRHWPQVLVPTFAVVLIALLMFRDSIWPRVIDDPFIPKGAAILVVHRKTDQGSEEVSSSVPVAPGDTIRFEVKAAANGYLAVLGRDARGAITVYHPYGGTAAQRFNVSQPVLPGAFVLDDTLGREDLYVLHSAHPFELGWAIQALEKGRELQKVAPQGVTVGSTFFMKAKAP